LLSSVSAWADSKPAQEKAPPTLKSFVSAKVLPWGWPQVMTSGFAFRELDAMDSACDEAWAGLASKAAYDAYRLEMRRKMLSAIGTLPPRTPLNPRTVATYRRDGYRIEKVIFESMPGLFVTANLFLPDGAEKAPGVVMSCGHSGEGKDYPTYLRACVIAVKKGFATLMFDPHHQGERSTPQRPSSTRAHTQMGLRGQLLDWSAPLLRIWDGMRAIDYLQSRPEVDAARIGYMGQSGGGTMTALMQAADDRIKVAAPSCFLTSLRALCRVMGPQDGEQNIFGQLAFGLNHTGYVLIPDIPVAVTAKFSDAFPYFGVRTLMKTVRACEAGVGLGERAFLNCSPGPHGWTEANEQGSVRFLARHLIPGCRDEAIDLEALWQLDLGYDISTVDVGLSESERGCTPERSTAKLPGSRSIYDMMAEKAVKARVARQPLDAAGRRAAVRRLAKIQSPAETGYRAKEIFAGEVEGCRVARLVVQFPKTGHMLPAVCVSRPGATGDPVVVAAWQGRAKGLAAAKALIEEGRPVMIADLSAVGEIGREMHLFYGAKDRLDEGTAVMYYLMGETLVGRRATDLLIFSDIMAQRCGGRRPHLLATGPLAIPAAHAYAAEPTAWSGITVKEPLAAWGKTLEGGDADLTNLYYADIVPQAYLFYDWTDLLP
jgi:dienelactone hydrolase